MAESLKTFTYSVAGIPVVICHRDLNVQEEDAPDIDPCFFDRVRYQKVQTIAARWLQVWDGTHALCALLQHSSVCNIHGQRVLELGAGTGLAGIVAASRGAHVLLTDLQSLTPLLWRNIHANAVGDARATATASKQLNAGGQQAGQVESESGGWSGACRVGAAGGTAAACALDWTAPCGAQLAQHVAHLPRLQAVIACEVLWLQELVEAYCETLAWLLSLPQRPRCFMTFTARGTERSRTFVCKPQVLQCLARLGCAVQELPELAAQAADGEAIEAWIVTRADAQSSARPA